MEYKEFFEKALSDAENRYPPSDVGTALDNITKRAGTAENVNIRARGGFVSAAPTASERFHSVLTAAGYIAGAAAVLAGCFFGLKFVIENGGLKEGGPGGSNPSVTVAATSEHEAAPTADPGHPATTAGNDAAGEPTPTLGMWRVPEEPVYRFNGFSCKFTQYWYDGMTLYLSYEITFDGGVPEKYKSDAVIRENELPGSFANDVILQAVHGDVRIRPEEKTTVHVRDDKTVSVSWQHTNCELMRSMDIMVMTSDASKYPADMTEPYYVYTVTMPDDMGGYSIDLGVPVSQPNGDTITLKHIDICKYTVGFVFDGKWKDEYELNADIVWLYDDTPVNITLDGSRPFFSANDDSYHYLLYRQSTPSPELIKSVIINGTETDLEDWLSIPEAVPEADKDEWEKEQTRQAFYYPFFAINTIPDSLLALAEPNELEKWELMSVDITKDPPESITDYANICTFIAHFGISPEDAENALGDEYREYIGRMCQNSEEADRVIDIICSGVLDDNGTVGELINNTTWGFGGKLICPNWLYVHSLDEWKAAGVKAATVSTMYDYYINNDVLNEEQTAEFKAKIDRYIAENKQSEAAEYVYDEDGDVVPNAVVAPNEPVTDDELKALIEQGPEACGLTVTVSKLTRGSLHLDYKLDENAPFAGIWYLRWYDHYEIQVQNASGEWETYEPEGYEMFFSNGTIFDGIHELGTLYDEFRGEEKQTVLFYGNYVFGDMYESELPNGKYRIMKKLAAYSTATGENIGTLTVCPEFEINDLTQNIFDIVLSVSNVSPEGVTVEVEHDGRDFLYMKNTIGYRPAFTLQRYENGSWKGVPTINGGIPSWNDTIYPVTVGGKIEINRDFSSIYGSLPDGRYRISTTFVNYRVDHSGITSILNESVYYIEFNIENYRPSNFGITLEAAEVSPEEVTCRIKQSGGTIKGSLGYLAEWYAEKETDNGSWEKLESNPTLWAPDITAVPLGGSTARRFKLAEEYGKLKNGHYRIWFDFIDYTPTSGSPETGNVTKNSSESLCFDFNITDSEKDWGLTLSVKDDVTAEGLTLVISQRGGSLTGELEYGEPYSIERKNGERPRIYH